MGLANFGLAALGGLEMPASEPETSYLDHKERSLALMRANDWKGALADLESCIQENPEDWDLLNALAVARFRTGDADDAVALLKRGIMESQFPRDFHHNLAFVRLSSEAPEDAVEAVEHALKAFSYSPEDTDIRRTLQRGGDAVLRAARRLLRVGSHSSRSRTRRDDRYRSLMECYRTVRRTLLAGIAAPNLEIQAEELAPSRPRISLVMIVKNEERFLRNCLNSARELVDEIVIVDTGSTDHTLAIAQEFGAKIVRSEWTDDFAAARNISLEHATGDWALWLDADEEIPAESLAAFQQAVDTAAPDAGGFMVEFHNWLQSTYRKADTDMAVHHACRLFRLLPGVRFEGRIHEQNLRSLQALGYHYAYTPGLIVDHFGYAAEIMDLRNKHERFIRMLTREVEECPDEALRHFHLFNLGNAYYTRGDMENAAAYLRLAAMKPDLKEEFTSTLFTELATALQRLDRAEEGLAVCEEADAIGLRQSGVEFARGYCLLHLLRYAEAEKAFRCALLFGESMQPMSHTGDRGVSSYKAAYGLALALVGQDRYDEALTSCDEALQVQEGFLEAQYLRAVALRRLGRQLECRIALDALLQRHPDHDEARKDLCAVLCDLGDFEQACRNLEISVRSDRDSYELHAMLAMCCERIGRVNRACEVYERLHQLAPNSAEVCVNMGRALAASGFEEDALACFTEAITLSPDYENAYFNAGDLLYRLEQFDQAAESYMAGLQLNPDHPTGLFVLGNCFFKTSKYDAAALLYEEQLDRDPNHKEARHNLSLITELAA